MLVEATRQKKGTGSGLMALLFRDISDGSSLNLMVAYTITAWPCQPMDGMMVIAPAPEKLFVKRRS